MPRPFPLASLLLLPTLLALGGCSSTLQTPTREIAKGDWQGAHSKVRSEIVGGKSKRAWMLSRMRAGILAMDAGQYHDAHNYFDQCFEIMRTQGLNADRTISSWVINEGVKIWKGEPFEQALMLQQYATLFASEGSWDNARAALDNALFSLAKLGEEPGGMGKSAQQKIKANQQLAYEKAREQGLNHEDALKHVEENHPTGATHGYVVDPTDFTLGHIMFGIAAQQLGRDDEAEDHFATAQSLRADLTPLLTQLRNKQYNAIVLVGYGLSPRKIATGSDNSATTYIPRTNSDQANLNIEPSPEGAYKHTVLCDANSMAGDHRWRDLEEVRKFKSVAGKVATVAGVAVLHSANNRDTALVGLGLIAIGTLSRISAHANTNYCDVLPQRWYLVPLQVPEQGATYTLSIQGNPLTQSELEIKPRADKQAACKWIRLPGW